MKPSLIMFGVNLLAVLSFLGWQLHQGIENPNAAGFAVASLAWGLAMLIQEYTTDFRIRLLEHQKQELQAELRKLKLNRL